MSFPSIRTAFSSLSTSKTMGNFERVFLPKTRPVPIHTRTGNSSQAENSSQTGFRLCVKTANELFLLNKYVFIYTLFFL